MSERKLPLIVDYYEIYRYPRNIFTRLIQSKTVTHSLLEAKRCICLVNFPELYGYLLPECDTAAAHWYR